jgi:hypothetical protein
MNESDLGLQLSRLEGVMTGVLALLAADRDERLADTYEPRRSEAILFDAGMPINDIAAALGRNREAVKSTIRRSKR